MCSVTPIKQGVLDAELKETLEFIGKKAGMEASERDAKRVAEETAKKLGGEAANILNKYGAAGFYAIVAKPERIGLVDALGADALAAIGKHGAPAADMLIKYPDADLAKLLATIGPEPTPATPPSAVTVWTRKTENAGKKSWKFVHLYPKLCAVVAIIALIAIIDVDILINFANGICSFFSGLWSVIGGTASVGAWILNNLWWSLLIAVAALCLFLRYRANIYGCIRAIRSWLRLDKTDDPAHRK